mgnify:CR=1 FL=1
MQNGKVTLKDLMPVRAVVRQSVAKINLGLRITGKRPDGYHNLETIFYPVEDLFDDLTVSVEPEEQQHILLASGRPIPGDPAENLVLQAAELLRTEFPQLPYFRIRLHKRIPAGAGLGGGSSNAANMLLAINELVELDLSIAQLHSYAVQLGADVPFFLRATPQVATGIGDTLQEFPIDALKQYRINVLQAGVHSDTASAYRGIDLSPPAPEELPSFVVRQFSPEEWKERLLNDFEPTVFRRYPVISKLKSKLYKEGAIYAAMSGSGSAVFGLFQK